MPPTPDPAAAAIHRRRAGEHYDAAERFRRLGMTNSREAALAAARHEDATAEILDNPSADREREVGS